MSTLSPAARVLLSALVTHYRLSLIKQLRRAATDPQLPEQDCARLLRDLELTDECTNYIHSVQESS